MEHAYIYRKLRKERLRMAETKVHGGEKAQVKHREKPFWEKLVEYHTDFLDAIKGVYPLGVLSSLSMTTAAFISTLEEGSMILAQTYATTAALLFLLAFTSSFFLKIYLLLDESANAVYFAIISYICTVSGVVFLFMVIKEFILSVLPVTEAIAPVMLLIVFVFILLPVPFLIDIAEASGSRVILIASYATFAFSLFVVSWFSISTLNAYGLFPPLPHWWGHLVSGSLYGYTILMILTTVLGLVLRYMKTRKKRK